MSLVKPGDNAAVLVVISLLAILTLLVAATLTDDPSPDAPTAPAVDVTEPPAP